MKNKFEFQKTDKISEENKIEKKDDSQEMTKKQKDNQKDQRKENIKKFSAIILIHVLGASFVVGIGLIWQDSYDIMAWANAFLLSFIMIFFVGWIMFIHNKNILSVVTHSFRTFGLMIVGKRPAKSYYEVKTEIEDHPIPNIYLIITFLFSLVLLIVTIILTLYAL